jgi:hypothetical protein
MSRPESSELQSLNNSTRNTTSSNDTSPTSPITTPSPPFAQPKEYDVNIPAVPGKTQRSDSSSVTLNPPTFKRGMNRKQLNPVMMQRLEQYQKKKQNIAQTEEEPDFTFATKTGEQFNISPGKYAKKVLDENEKYFKQAHRIGAEPNTTTTPKPEPEPEPEPEPKKKKKRYKGPGKATTNILDLS